jgi:hypothetical protein
MVTSFDRYDSPKNSASQLMQRPRPMSQMSIECAGHFEQGMGGSHADHVDCNGEWKE